MKTRIRSIEELRQFVADLRIPQERREVTEAELLDHVNQAISRGASEEDAVTALGDLDELKMSFEEVEPRFHVSWRTSFFAGGRIGALYVAASALALLACHALKSTHMLHQALLHFAVLATVLLVARPRRILSQKQAASLNPFFIVPICLLVLLGGWVAMTDGFISAIDHVARSALGPWPDDLDNWYGEVSAGLLYLVPPILVGFCVGFPEDPFRLRRFKWQG
jgi:hypothetical protein